MTTERKIDISKPLSFNDFRADFIYCERIIKAQSKTFYAAFSRLPQQEAWSVYAIYCFCRKADDLIDDNNDSIGLARLEDELITFVEQQMIPYEPMWRALAVVFSNYKVYVPAFYDMLHGQKLDAHFKQPANYQQLKDYCYYVAGSVGLMLLPVLSNQPESGHVYAKKMGEALQLTNILRDIGEDYERQRIYLTKESFSRYGINQSTIATKQVTPAFINLWEAYAKKAEKLYDESFQLLPFIKKEARMPLTAACVLYREILNVIRENNYTIFTNRHFVSHTRKLRCMKELPKILNTHCSTE